MQHQTSPIALRNVTDHAFQAAYKAQTVYDSRHLLISTSNFGSSEVHQQKKMGLHKLKQQVLQNVLF